jgi:hypothetical protein
VRFTGVPSYRTVRSALLLPVSPLFHLLRIFLGGEAEPALQRFAHTRCFRRRREVLSFLDGAGHVTVVGTLDEWNVFVMKLAERILEWGDESLLVIGQARFEPQAILELAESIRTSV